jgi:hypothetical protein
VKLHAGGRGIEREIFLQYRDARGIGFKQVNLSRRERVQEIHRVVAQVGPYIGDHAPARDEAREVPQFVLFVEPLAHVHKIHRNRPPREREARLDVAMLDGDYALTREQAKRARAAHNRYAVVGLKRVGGRVGHECVEPVARRDEHHPQLGP